MISCFLSTSDSSLSPKYLAYSMMTNRLSFWNFSIMSMRFMKSAKLSINLLCSSLGNDSILLITETRRDGIFI